MFKSIEDVKNTDIGDLVKLVNDKCYNATYSDILDEETYEKYVEASQIVRETEQHAEKIAFAIRDRVESEGSDDDSEDEDDYENSLSEFMQAIAVESGEMYTDYDYNTHPDQFWTPSTCY